MAKMYGKRGQENWHSGGDGVIPKRTIRSREETLAIREALQEMQEAQQEFEAMMDHYFGSYDECFE